MRHLIIALALVFAISYGTNTWTPAHLIRVHEMSATQIGMTLALIIGLGGGIGTALCGFLADRLGKIDVRWNFWLLACIALASAPFLLLTYNSESTFLTIVFLIPAISLNMAYLGPALAMMQSLVRPNM